MIIRNFRSNLQIGYGRACATFGELLQGVLPSERNFLVTFPIEKYSYATFDCTDDFEIIVVPEYKKKALKIAKLVLRYLEKPLTGVLKIDSEVPEGKGMASSSSDLVATVRAIEDCFNIKVPFNCLETFMSEIEPSDGVMYNACVSYYQREAILRSHLGTLPSMVIVGIDEGGEVDTIEFNKRRKTFSDIEKNEYLTLLHKLEIAVRKKDLYSIGKIATRSAILNQKLKPNKYLDSLIEINKQIKGLGIAIAHSGTYVGLLLDSTDFNLLLKIEKIKTLLSSKEINIVPQIYYSLY